MIAGTTYVAPAAFFVAFGRVSDYHTMAIWLAPFAGIALAQTSWSRWHIPRSLARPVRRLGTHRRRDLADRRGT